MLKITGGIGKGGCSFSIDFDITRSFSHTDNEVHSVKLLQTYNAAPSIMNEVSKTNVLIIPKIRYTIDSNGDGYVDIRYDSTAANDVAVDFTVHTPYIYQHLFVAVNMTFTGTNDPANETVLTMYTFAANTITDISSSFALNISGVGKIHAIYDASSGLVHLNFSVYTASTFDTSMPIFTCSNSRYVPKATAYGNGMIRLYNGEWYPYDVGISTTGNIFQALTGDATRVYGQITYPV